MTNLIRVEKSDAVATLTLNDPDNRNPITDLAMIDAIIEAIAAIDADPSVNALILIGEGKAFSTGGNVKKMVAGAGLVDEDPLKTLDNYKRGIQRIPLAFDALEVPTIAAVNGPAIGAGNDLACMCDIRIAAKSAIFAESFVKLGIIPGDGGAWLLPRVVGYSKAYEMTFTGDAINADEALKIGLVSKVVEDSELLDAARELGARIAANPRDSVRMAKQLMKAGRQASLSAVLELSASLQALSHTTAYHKKAVSDFIEKRR